MNFGREWAAVAGKPGVLDTDDSCGTTSSPNPGTATSRPFARRSVGNGRGGFRSWVAAAAEPFAIALLLAIAGTANAAPLGRTVLEGGDPGRRALYQSWIDASRAPQVKATVRLLERDCPEPEAALCVSIPNGKTWRLYIDAEWAEPQNTGGRYSELWVLHELGHVYDFSYTRDKHRTKFLRALDTSGWLDPLNETWEKFAMAYAYCGAGMSWAQYRRELPADGGFASRLSTPEGGFWGYGYDVGKRAYEAGCRAVGRRAAGS